jgi:hypothetical protein
MSTQNAAVRRQSPATAKDNGANGHMPEALEAVEPQQTPFYKRILPLGRLHIMSEDKAKAQGVFIPNWWLALLLIPLAGGVMWVVITLTQIQSQQAALQAAIEYRLKASETQGRLNDEHTRQLEIEIARTKGAVDTLAAINGQKKKEN